MANAKSYTLYKDADCTELATAQEVYDAYVSGSMQTIVPDADNMYSTPINVGWQDSNANQADATNVQAVVLRYMFNSNIVNVTVGDPSNHD